MAKPPLTTAQAEQLQAAAQLFGKHNATILGNMEKLAEGTKYARGSGDLFNEFDSYVENKVHVRRVLKDHEHDNNPEWTSMPTGKDGKPQAVTAIACHCKLVCADEKVMYVGSDNAYPSYNEEHGIWHEDETAIKEWKDKFWTTLWTERARTDTK